ncbi:KH domain-containing protein At4g18375 [Dendrobium catenatum]|uniref:KH domain-containing protein n=1 Tax=Dendrobium catenatum TaxID=906689 RepID=A0A2I0VVG3_9ASPA|nr:KH domain-containing protein At4g18375 [Dendrobium catenatum]XP_028555566.1 KH domain-containing protein At4g18375 [Dendrobium catenatum]PKU67397.1 KH domain-containing protein [Dendrobium catenatum]
MAEFGKRSRRGDDDTVGKNQKRRVGNKENFDDGDLVLYRILCPDNVIGSVIGKGGKVINSLRQETHAKIKVVDPYPGAQKRVIIVYCYVKDKEPVEVDDEITKPLCPAQDGLLRVHAAIVNALSNTEDDDQQGKEEVELLVPTSQSSNIIGKSGTIIKKLRAKTKAVIKINAKDASNAAHSCAMSFDNFLQITGDAVAVKKALLAVSAIMYKFSPKEDISLDTTIAEIPPSIIIPSDVPIYPSSNFYHSTDAIVAPSRSVPSVIGATQHVPELHGYTDSASTWPVYSSTIPVLSGYGGPSRTEEFVVRVLCPSDKIGRVIGKGGSTIKTVRQSSGASVDVDDTKKKNDECIITVSSTESLDDVKSAAVEAVLLLQGKIHDEDDKTVSIRLLVPTKVIGCLIGKGGSIINEMRKKTKAEIRISKSEKAKSASSDEERVEVSGEVSRVREALLQIILRLREDALKDREGSNAVPPIDSLYTSNLSVPPLLPGVQSVSSLGYDHRTEPGSGLGLLSSNSLYGYNSLQAGENAYGSLSSYSSKSYGGLPSYVEMSIPSHAIGKVLGKGGSNLANIRKISGADIEIVDSKSSRFERIAQISGTPDQKRSAENLIQAFIMST